MAKRLCITKKETVISMIENIEYYSMKMRIDLTNNIPEDVNDFDNLFNDGGEGRCEYFTDIALPYALQFGFLEDYTPNGCMDHQWECIESAITKLRKKYN